MKKTIFAVLAAVCLAAAMPLFGQVQVAPFLSPTQQFFDNSGSPCVGCTLSFFNAGTSTPAPIYTDSTGTVQAANPLTLDSAGRGTVWLASQSYKIILKSAAGVTLWSADSVTWDSLAQTLTLLTVNGQTQIIPSTAATSGANQSGPNVEICGNFWNGSASAADCWNWQDVLGTGTNPTSTLTLSHSGSSGTTAINIGSNSLTAGAGTFTSNFIATAGQNKLNFYQANNRIYVDGVKYTLDRTGIAAAIADACAMTGGNTNGTFLYLPPMNITVATGFTVTAPIHIIGSGVGQTLITATTGPLFTLSPSANYSQTQEWEIAHGFWIATSGNVISFSDANGFPLNRLYVHDNEIYSSAASSFAIAYAGTIANGGFDWIIERNYFGSGISLTRDASGHGLADGLFIAHNTFDPAIVSSTTVAMQLDSMSGAAQWTVFHNRGSLGGGFISSTGTTELQILSNQIEQTTGTPTNVINLSGSTFSIQGSQIAGNNINNSTATNTINLDHTSNTFIHSNVIGSIATTGVGINISANSTSTQIGPNNFSNGGGGAKDTNDLGVTTQFIGVSGINAANTTIYAPADNLAALVFHAHSGTQTQFPLIYQKDGSTFPFMVTASGVVGFSATTSLDTGVSRVAAGVVGAGTGGAANVSGEFRSAKISATYNAAGTVQTAVHIVQDTCTIGTSCAVTLSGSAAFSSSSSYHCTASDATAAAAVKVAQASGSSVTFTGTGTDVLNYICIGN